MKIDLILGNCLEKLEELPENSVDSIVTDPPYGLSFMGKDWDKGVPGVHFWAEMIRVLKPGGHLLAFSGTRTYHRMASAIEDAGFEVRDMIEWVYGCLSEDTEILTANGWKMLYSVFEGDYVFACDYKNDMKLQLEPVKQKFIYDYDEDAYHIKDTGYYNSELMETDHIVSKNHNVLVLESWVRNAGFGNDLYWEKIPAEKLYENIQKIGGKKTFRIPGLNGDIPCTIKKIPYKGKVWCVEVESGAFVARRKGKIFITGNSGFPKSLNIGKAVNSLETNEWSKISKAFDNVDQKSIMEVWKTNAKLAGIKLVKNLTGVGSNTRKKYFVHDIAVLYFNQEKENASAITAELNLCVPSRTSEENLSIAVGSVEQNTELSQNLVKSVVKLSENQRAKSWNIFTAQCDVKEWLNENTEVNHKVDEALKTLRGNKKYSNEEIINVLCVALTDILKLTILSQSNTFQNLDTKSQTDFLSATNVIITEYTAENLISNTVAILKSKAVDKLQGNEREVSKVRTDGAGNGNSENVMYDADHKFVATKVFNETKGTSEWEGWGTALKPAHEPIVVARKPLSEKTVAENVLKWGTGGINIDESRVGTDILENGYCAKKQGYMSDEQGASGGAFSKDGMNIAVGRFPANLIHDNSEEVRECFPEAKGASSQNNYSNGKIYRGQSLLESETKLEGHRDWYNDNGNASRFFKSIIYQAKASKSERNRGCEGLEEKYTTEQNKWTENDYRKGDGEKTVSPTKNNHPTVKPIALMEYLIKMVTPKGGTVLDPFMGSGSTGVACQRLGMDFIGIELVPEYFEIANARLKVKEILLNLK